MSRRWTFTGRLDGLSSRLTASIKLHLDFVLITAVICVGAWIATASAIQLASAGVKAQFYQYEFAPAVLAACGQGFHNTGCPSKMRYEAGCQDDSVALVRFLSLTDEVLSCADLPANMPVTKLSFYQYATLYLQLSVAAVWYVLGVDWLAVLALSVVFAVTYAACLYGICRFVLRPGWAAITTLLIFLSPLHLNQLLSIRDYSKAPFFLLIILATGTLVRRSFPVRLTLALAGVTGAVAGIGMGFRADIAVAVPLVIGSLIVFLPYPFRASLKLRAMAVGAFLLGTTAMATPVLMGWSRGSNLSHIVLLGLSHRYTDRLGLQHSDYVPVLRPKDKHVRYLVRDYATGYLGQTEYLSIGTPEYDRSSSKLLLRMLEYFPADFCVRTLAASWLTVSESLGYSANSAPPWSASTLLGKTLKLRARLAGLLEPLVAIAVLAAILGVLLIQGRFGLWAIILAASLAGSVAIEFQERHWFYLTFIAWVCIGFTIQSTVDLVVWLGWSRQRPAFLCTRRVLQVAILSVAFACTSVATIMALRAVQTRKLRNYALQLKAHPLVPFGSGWHVNGERATLNTTPLTAYVPGQPIRSNCRCEYLAFDLNGACSARNPVTLDVLYRYHGRVDYGFTDRIKVGNVGRDPEGLRLFVPVSICWDGWLQLDEIETTADMASCVELISRVEHPETLPLKPLMVVQGDAAHQTWYQRFPWEPRVPKRLKAFK
jgi:hypothetical protein